MSWAQADRYVSPFAGRRARESDGTRGRGCEAGLCLRAEAGGKD